MKKVFKLMMMALAAIVMSAGFAACSSSDDDNTTPEDQGEITASITISYDIKEDIELTRTNYSGILVNPDYAKTTITYYDENSQEVTEEIKDGKFSKTITYKKLPAKVGYTINYELLDENNIDLSKKYCFINQEASPMITIMKGEKPLKAISNGELTSKSYTKDNAFTTTKEFKKAFQTALPTYSKYYTIQADGSIK